MARFANLSLVAFCITSPWADSVAYGLADGQQRSGGAEPTEPSKGEDQGR